MKRVFEPREIRRLITVQLEGDVNNDGFDGFFGFSGGDALATIEALEAIGAPKTAEIVRRACAKFPGGNPPSDHAIRSGMLVDEVNPDGDAFEAQDADFLRYEEDLEGLVTAYEAGWASGDIARH